MANEIKTTTDTNPLVRSVEFINKFMATIAPLLTLLGIIEPEVMAAGTQVEQYEFGIKGQLNGGTVNELAAVPNTEIEEKLVNTYKVSLKKYATETSEEKILQSGYQRAVEKRDAVLITEIAKSIRQDFFEFLAEGTTKCAGSDLKSTLARAAGKLASAASATGRGGTAVFFANPEDVYAYLGDANVYNVETEFGLQYIKNFLGIGTVILDAYVPANSVYATYVENINGYAADVAELNKAGGERFVFDDSGIIAVAHDRALRNGSVGTHVRTGLVLFPENATLIVVGTIAPTVDPDNGD